MNTRVLTLLIAGGLPATERLTGQNTGDTDVPTAMLARQDVDHWLTSAIVNGGDMPLPKEPPISLSFHSGGIFSGSSGVNRYFGIMEIMPDGTYRWEPPGLALTNVAGEPALMDLERRFLDSLWSTRTLRLLDDGVALSSENGTTILRFTRTLMEKRISALQNVDFRLTRLVADSKQKAIPDAAKVTFKMIDGTRFTGHSGVNFYSGSFRVDSDGRLEFLKLTEATQMAGPPELMDLESAYFNALGMVQRLRPTANGLILEKDDKTVVLEFTSQRSR
jgi:heat shock protein HslJ